MQVQWSRETDLAPPITIGSTTSLAAPHNRRIVSIGDPVRLQVLGVLQGCASCCKQVPVLGREITELKSTLVELRRVANRRTGK